MQDNNERKEKPEIAPNNRVQRTFEGAFFGNESLGRTLYFGGGDWNVNDANRILFFTDSNYSGGTNEGALRMIIEQSGNVGIGTTTPQSRLHVNGYVQLALTSGAPPAADCDNVTEYGRMKVDSTGNGSLYICVENGWISK